MNMFRLIKIGLSPIRRLNEGSIALGVFFLNSFQSLDNITKIKSVVFTIGGLERSEGRMNDLMSTIVS